ncbi:nuclease-related domain-containing protein [Neobacillus mesonae]|uniref:nuclease-related domain-containing protein n=1 Tax=Neobacillus mesonae TaxID=1193713 RepID=UPI002E1CBE15|nr:nuclease-related domain-containing protein [Neobacillus mesonae]
MLLKSRYPTMELKGLISLNARMNLSEEDSQHYLYLEKGYQGELMFDQLTEKLQCDMYVINDLCLEHKGTTFQIDSIIIAQKTIYPFEIKNYQDDYIFEAGNFRKLNSKNYITNPLEQLNRSKILLRQVLQSLRVDLPIEGYVSFVNPEFTLYNAPVDEPIILPTQLKNFLKKINDTPSKLNGWHKNFADQLVSKHINFPCNKFPGYKFKDLKKGFLCPVGHSFMIMIGGNKLVCQICGFEESVVSGVLRSVKEIKLLFPHIKITTNLVYEWCGMVLSKKVIRRILMENYKANGYGRWLYFE